MKRFEFGLRRKVEDAQGDQPALDAADEVPRGFRDLVDEYYRSLSRSGEIGHGFQVLGSVPRTWNLDRPELGTWNRRGRRFLRRILPPHPVAASAYGRCGRHVAWRAWEPPRFATAPSETVSSTSAASCTRAIAGKLADRDGAPTIPAPTSTSASGSRSSRKPPSAGTAKADPEHFVVRSSDDEQSVPLPVRAHRRCRNGPIQRTQTSCS